MPRLSATIAGPHGSALPVMQGQPHGLLFRVGPCHPVAAVGRDEEIIPGAQHPNLRLPFQPQPRGPGEQHHPFVGLLVVPLARRGGLAGGDDAFQVEAGGFQENLDDLFGDFFGNPGEEIVCWGLGNSLPSYS